MELRDVDAVFQADPEIVLTAVGADADALQFAALELLIDRELVTKCCSLDLYALAHVDGALHGNREFMLDMVFREADWALEFASPELLGDSSFMQEVERARTLERE